MQYYYSKVHFTFLNLSSYSFLLLVHETELPPPPFAEKKNKKNVHADELKIKKRKLIMISIHSVHEGLSAQPVTRKEKTFLCHCKNMNFFPAKDILHNKIFNHLNKL